MIIKILLSFTLIGLSVVALFSMLEIFRKQKGTNMDRLKKLHKVNGRLFFLVLIAGMSFCIHFISESKVELSPRATLHAFSAVIIFLLFWFKILFVRKYKEFYSYAKLLGFLMVLFSFSLFAFSAGYSLVLAESKEYSDQKTGAQKTLKSEGNLKNGEKLFQKYCVSCHYTDKKDYKRGAPGMKGILKEKILPVSKKPLTAENVAQQIRNPYRSMPSFGDLKDSEIADILTYLKTL
ncbi:MAG: cytochrome c [Deltaproteobacteria bacterium]|nr:cytochrome c [Deltaproteobacteria bacterium]